MVSTRGVLGIALLATQCVPSNGPSAAAPAPTSASAAAPGPAPGEAKARCGVRVGNDAEIYGCLGDHALLILPEKPWTVETATPPVFFSASRGFFHASMRLADAGETGYPVEEHLRAIYQGIAAAKGEGHVGPMKAEKSGQGRFAVLFEVEGITLGGKAVRSIHVWNALRRPDHRYVDYHLSWTGPADDPELSPASGRDPLAHRMVNFADAFMTVDDAGHSAPQ